MRNTPAVEAIRRAIKRRQGIANRAAQNAALNGRKYLTDFHAGGYSALACLLEDFERIVARAQRKAKQS